MSRDKTIRYDVVKPPDFPAAATEVLNGIRSWLDDAQLDLAIGWLLEQDRRTQPGPVPKGIVPGLIIELELGVAFEHEYALQHPCLVLRKRGDMLTVVPLTSQGTGRGFVVTDDGLSERPLLDNEDNSYRVEFVLPGAADTSVALIDQIRTVDVRRVVRLWYHGSARMLVPVTTLQAVESRVSALAAPSVFNGRNQWKRKYDELVVDFKKSKENARKLRKELELLRSMVKQGADQLETAMEVLALAEQED